MGKKEGPFQDWSIGSDDCPGSGLFDDRREMDKKVSQEGI